MGAGAVIDTGAPVVVLVSCDPVAGARDAKYLCDAGYSLEEMEVLDIFPETHHVEVVSIFTR
jgi:tRNA/tmRNA/rRNA uracil-C5-methylase (TrmA/RlmC/RlmD family)